MEEHRFTFPGVQKELIAIGSLVIEMRGPVHYSMYDTDKNVVWPFGLASAPHTMALSLLYLDGARYLSKKRHWYSRRYPPPREFELPIFIDFEAEVDIVD